MLVSGDDIRLGRINVEGGRRLALYTVSAIVSKKNYFALYVINNDSVFLVHKSYESSAL